MSRQLVVAFLGLSALLLLPIGVLVWGFRTARALWRRGTTPWGRLVYDYGVRGFGVMLAVTVTVFAGYAAYVSANSPTEAFWLAIVVAALVATLVGPACLGLGYIWGTWTAYFMGLEPDVKSPRASLAPNKRWRGP